uniref:unspecific monooxygenase n=1 Tax=Spodoptera exigua TaxID=7107 RepID=E5L8C3_SPOEX|nr:cytochrome P450 [Spodoptera exigua]ASO98013.1 cytochrome p450 CYP9A11 [Spodoptera exigua]QIC54203.1 cytochrome P450 9A11 [Spodoptera exigua]QIC54204.1 cytochrome P450 9A11 [Spodoptera exigua]
MIIFFIWLVVLIAALALHLRQMHSAFSKHGIKYLNPAPLLGNMINTIFLREHFAYDVLRLYGSFPKDRFVGRYEFTNKAIMLRDLDLVKKITVKDFEVFLDHRDFGGDTFFGRTLILMRGQEWKDMRSTLSPAFTSSKIRLMVPFMVEVGDQMIQSLNKEIEKSSDGYIDVDCKDLTTRYANDVIASCAFGLKVNSHAEKNNEFYIMGRTAANFGLREMFMFIFMVIAPKIVALLKWNLVPDKMKNYFTNLVLDTMKDRELRHIFRPDMIHLLMEAKKGQLTHEDAKSNNDTTGFATVEESTVGLKKTTNRVWNDNDLSAQAFLFFIAGFETVSTSMSFLLYELAVNPDVQERLAQEIKEHDVKHGGKFDFNSIQNMKYMDMVVSELLRLWPPLTVMDRECNRDYNMGKPNEDFDKDYILPKGTTVFIPTFAFHRDPQYFPDPEKFDPERFSEENRHKLNLNAYMPFGVGPRNCIGSRFALCELKVLTYQILLHMELSPSEKTQIPARLAPDNINVRLQGGHWLRFRQRK